jgi:thioredoxin-related protein
VKKLSFFIIFLCLASFSKGQGIHFSESETWAEIKSQAKAENKYIFVDAYTTWCAPCKIMDSEVYTLKTVGDFFNNKFISVKFQLDQTSQDDAKTRKKRPDAAKLKGTFDVNTFPTYLFFTPDGDIVYRATGSMGPEAFINEAGKSLDSKLQFTVLKHKYESNERDPQFVRDFCNLTANIGRKEEARKIAQDYINSLTEQEALLPENIHFIYAWTKSVDERGFKFFRDNRVQISKIFPPYSLENTRTWLANHVYNDEIVSLEHANNGKPDYIKIQNAVKKYGEVGRFALQNHMPNIIYRDLIRPNIDSKNNTVDWANIKKNMKSLGWLGEHTLKVHNQTIVYDVEMKSRIKSEMTNSDWVVIETAVKSYGKDGKLMFLRSKAIHALNRKDLQLLMTATPAYLKLEPKGLDLTLLNNMAWMVFELSKDHAQLTMAKNWANQAVQMDASSTTIDTYANLLYKLGRRDDAIQWQKKAVAKDPANADIVNVLYKMENGLTTWPEN